MTQWIAIYRNTTGQEIQIPLTESNGQFFLESESGKPAPFSSTITDKELGLSRHIKTIKAEEPVPMPYDPQREELLAALDAALRRIPTTDYDAFLNREAKLKRAVNAQFAGATKEQLAALVALVKGEIARLADARRKSIPPPTFEIEARRRNFMGVRLGSLFVEENEIPSSLKNGWNGTFTVRCDQCRTLKGTITVEHVLEMQCGWRDPFVCGQPCVKG